jgi:hypothetical protein
MSQNQNVTQDMSQNVTLEEKKRKQQGSQSQVSMFNVHELKTQEFDNLFVVVS